MESRIQEAIRFIERFPEAPVAKVAEEFEVPRGRLRYRLSGMPPKRGLPAHNTKLTEPEEKALCRYIDRLDALNLAVRPEFVTDAADTILRERSSKIEAANPPTVGRHWTTRFLKRHGYNKRRQKRVNAERKESEDLVRVEEYFRQLQLVIQEEGIPPESIWNMDETGFQIGVGKDQLIITKRKRAHYFSMPENRESATAIEAISAGGHYLPAFLILSGQLHMTQWYTLEELHGKTILQTAATGYTNDEISLGWLEHFNEHSAKTSLGAKRLLILDGHGSHHTKQFIQYCDDNGIMPFGMPPHLTHLLQPLDVVVFQPLKHYHAKALNIMVRDGLVNITKIEFLSCIEDVRRQAFKESTILSAFRKTGIWPYNPEIVLNTLKARQPERTPSPDPTAHLQSSPFTTPLTLRQINKVADQLESVLEQDQTLDPTFTHNISRFVRGSLSLATELVQTKRDLGRTRLAEETARRRRASKNTSLQSGGRLRVEDAREMIRQNKEDDIEKARRLVEAADQKAKNARKRLFEEAAKEARKWRTSGRLGRAEVVDSEGGKRLLIRF
jgi:hypothetical protein